MFARLDFLLKALGKEAALRWILTIALLATPLFGGCQSAVMVGRILFGDPEIPSEFEQTTQIRLDEQTRPVAVVCTSPSMLTTEYETLPIDLPEELLRRLRLRGIPTGNADKALNAAADVGGQFDAREIARGLDSGYLVHIDLEQFSLSEDDGNTLFRGRARGTVSVYRTYVREADDEDAGDATEQKRVVELFQRGFQTTYPGSHPVPVDQTPEKVFRKRFINHIADVTGRKLYRYRTSDTF